MKKLIIITIMLFSTIGFAQARFGLGVNYSSEKTVAVNILAIDESIVYGFGVSTSPVHNDLKGSSYKAYINYVHQDFGDQTELNTVYHKDYSAYLMLGKEIGPFRLVGKLGLGTEYKYTNYYDRYPQYYYYKQGNMSSCRVLVGGEGSLLLNKYFSLDVGYDTYNHGTLGVSLLF